MRRWQLLLAAAVVFVLLGWGLRRAGWWGADSHASIPAAGQSQGADPFDSTSGWRYRQNLPHHWRYIVLQN